MPSTPAAPVVFNVTKDTIELSWDPPVSEQQAGGIKEIVYCIEEENPLQETGFVKAYESV